MARRLVEAPIATRASRASLPEGLHWRGLDTGIHLGYRKARSGGAWIARWYTGESRCYRRIDLGPADDVIAVGTLSYSEAISAAKEAVANARRRKAIDAAGPVLTVRLAIEQYLVMRDARDSQVEGREVRSDGSYKLSRHVSQNESFLDIRLDALTEADLLEWANSLDDTLKGSTKRRIITDLKAALNAMYRKERRRLPSELAETIRFGLAAEAIGSEPVDIARENQILDNETIRQVVKHSYEIDDDFGLLVLVLAATGARFCQLKRMKVRDVQTLFGRLMVPKSRKGRNKVAGYTPVRIGPDVMGPLKAAIAGRRADDAVFCRWRHVQTGPATWQRDSRGPWRTPSEMIRPWGRVCEKLELSGIVPYSLRHSSIVRGIAAGLPIRLVAALHDTSVAMIEKHYSRWIVDGLEDLAATAIVPLMNEAA